MVSILKKAIMAVTGLGWFVYVVLHLAGNLLLFKGPETYNAYSEFLVSNPLIIPAELGLLVFLVAHLASAWRVTRENSAARPQPYLERVLSRRGGTTSASGWFSTFASRTMWYGGVLLLFFLILHVWMFKYGDRSGAHGLWGLVVRSFKNPWISAIYIAAMLPLGFHLSHGFASALQTLGLLKPRWYPGVRRLSQVVGWVLAAGFILLPLWALLFAEV
ncbi:MAG: succinate dehydrogenase [Candidatus Tectimicrobiota bacterium]|nr:MAG: succinate dehydrogenase [Candidatus Tectomicrobia bacterium]